MTPLPPTSRLAAAALIGGQLGAVLGLIFVGGTLLAPLATLVLGGVLGPIVLIVRDRATEPAERQPLTDEHPLPAAS